MNSNQKQNNQFRSDQFFEAFRNLGDQPTPGQQSRQPLSGELQPNQNFDLQAEISRRENEAKKKARAHFEYVKRQDELVFSRKQEEIIAQIEAIQKELKKLITEAGEFAKEVEVAVEQVVVNPGIYHINFFIKIRQLLVLLRKKVQDSRTWMHTVNSRAKHKSYFWGQVGKSGTKFLLSQERYMSTQAG